ncbi:thioesterase II family protein [Actinophytocola sp.]|uniref:thioesterase II family protein n=1 Tax=Actinophytocola sp. TaxID=1872138 RepID=UPI002ED8A9FA
MTTRPPRSRPPVRLYCFPYAGATSSIYRSWQAKSPDSVQLVGIDPPGRGTRTKEPVIERFPELVASMAAAVAADLRRAGEPRYATFGHSLGGVVSLAVADAVAHRTGLPPERSFVSASLPPGLHKPVDETAGMTDAELVEKIRADGGTAPALLASEAMAAILVRLMREDHALRSQFAAEHGLVVGHPLTTIAALDDEFITPERMRRWAGHSAAAGRHVEIDGGHFAAFDDPTEVLAIVAHDLLASADRPAADLRHYRSAG